MLHNADGELESLPESWFTPTSSELKAAQTALATRVQALTNAPLQTRAMREASQKPKRERWPSVCSHRDQSYCLTELRRRLLYASDLQIERN